MSDLLAIPLESVGEPTPACALRVARDAAMVEPGRLRCAGPDLTNVGSPQVDPDSRRWPDRTTAPGSLDERRAFLRAFAALLRKRESELIVAMQEEIGKSPDECTLTETLPLLASLDWMSKRLPGLLKPHRVRGGAWWQRGDRIWVERVPLGRVLIIATWNYPVQLLGIQLAQSIAAGNETWVKPSERSPNSQALLLSIARQALAAAGLSQDLLVQCDATRAEGERLLAEHTIRGLFDHILFTGSTGIGRQIAEVGARTLTRTTLELSGQDSAVVLADADLRLAARSIWDAVVMNAGQTCMAPRRVLVQRDAYAAFLDRLAPLAAGARPVRMVDEAAAEHTFRVARAAVDMGGRSISGVLEGPTLDAANRAHLRPLAIAECPERSELFRGEHFGPALAVVQVDDIDHAVRLHQEVGHALATSIFTRRAPDPRWSLAFGSSFVTLNDCVRPTAHPATALAGRGPSGWGASRGISGLLALTREVTVTSRSWLTPPPERPGATAMGWIRRLSGLARPASSEISP